MLRWIKESCLTRFWLGHLKSTGASRSRDHVSPGFDVGRPNQMSRNWGWSTWLINVNMSHQIDFSSPNQIEQAFMWRLPRFLLGYIKRRRFKQIPTTINFSDVISQVAEKHRKKVNRKRPLWRMSHSKSELARHFVYVISCVQLSRCLWGEEQYVCSSWSCFKLIEVGVVVIGRQFCSVM